MVTYLYLLLIYLLSIFLPVWNANVRNRIGISLLLLTNVKFGKLFNVIAINKQELIQFYKIICFIVQHLS